MGKEIIKISNVLEKSEWYESLIDDCRAIITEGVFTSRWALIEAYHNLGKRILEENDNFKREKVYGEKIVQRVAVSLAKSERTIWQAIQFVTMFPILDKLPDGKNISWHKICNNLLPSPKKELTKLEPIEGTYNVIVIDPPWNYGTEYDSETRRVASPYKEISTEELKRFELNPDKDSVIWLWTTHKFIQDAFELLKSWGFEYKLTMVWDKQKMGMGEWLRCQAEFCLLGVKGDYHKHWKLTNERDVLSVARREHSRKPKEFYEMVKKLCLGKRIDIFSREKHDGFEQYGNEQDKY